MTFEGSSCPFFFSPEMSSWTAADATSTQAVGGGGPPPSLPNFEAIPTGSGPVRQPAAADSSQRRPGGALASQLGMAGPLSSARSSGQSGKSSSDGGTNDPAALRTQVVRRYRAQSPLVMMNPTTQVPIPPPPSSDRRTTAPAAAPACLAARRAYGHQAVGDLSSLQDFLATYQYHVPLEPTLRDSDAVFLCRAVLRLPSLIETTLQWAIAMVCPTSVDTLVQPRSPTGNAIRLTTTMRVPPQTQAGRNALGLPSAGRNSTGPGLAEDATGSSCFGDAVAAFCVTSTDSYAQATGESAASKALALVELNELAFVFDEFQAAFDHLCIEFGEVSNTLPAAGSRRDAAAASPDIVYRPMMAAPQGEKPEAARTSRVKRDVKDLCMSFASTWKAILAHLREMERHGSCSDFRKNDSITCQESRSVSPASVSQTPSAVVNAHHRFGALFAPWCRPATAPQSVGTPVIPGTSPVEAANGGFDGAIGGGMAFFLFQQLVDNRSMLLGIAGRLNACLRLTQSDALRGIAHEVAASRAPLGPIGARALTRGHQHATTLVTLTFPRSPGMDVVSAVSRWIDAPVTVFYALTVLICFAVFALSMILVGGITASAELVSNTSDALPVRSAAFVLSLQIAPTIAAFALVGLGAVWVAFRRQQKETNYMKQFRYSQQRIVCWVNAACFACTAHCAGPLGGLRPSRSQTAGGLAAVTAVGQLPPMTIAATQALVSRAARQAVDANQGRAVASVTGSNVASGGAPLSSSGSAVLARSTTRASPAHGSEIPIRAAVDKGAFILPILLAHGGGPGGSLGSHNYSQDNMSLAAHSLLGSGVADRDYSCLVPLHLIHESTVCIAVTFKSYPVVPFHSAPEAMQSKARIAHARKVAITKEFQRVAQRTIAGSGPTAVGSKSSDSDMEELDPDSLLIDFTDSQVVVWNAAAVTATGVNDSAAVGKPLVSFVDEDSTFALSNLVSPILLPTKDTTPDVLPSNLLRATADEAKVTFHSLDCGTVTIVMKAALCPRAYGGSMAPASSQGSADHGGPRGGSMDVNSLQTINGDGATREGPPSCWALGSDVEKVDSPRHTDFPLPLKGFDSKAIFAHARAVNGCVLLLLGRRFDDRALTNAQFVHTYRQELAMSFLTSADTVLKFGRADTFGPMSIPRPMAQLNQIILDTAIGMHSLPSPDQLPVKAALIEAVVAVSHRICENPPTTPLTKANQHWSPLTGLDQAMVVTSAGPTGSAATTSQGAAGLTQPSAGKYRSDILAVYQFKEAFAQRDRQHLLSIAMDLLAEELHWDSMQRCIHEMDNWRRVNISVMLGNIVPTDQFCEVHVHRSESLPNQLYCHPQVTALVFAFVEGTVKSLHRRTAQRNAQQQHIDPNALSFRPVEKTTVLVEKNADGFMPSLTFKIRPALPDVYATLVKNDDVEARKRTTGAVVCLQRFHQDDAADDDGPPLTTSQTPADVAICIYVPFYIQRISSIRAGDDDATVSFSRPSGGDDDMDVQPSLHHLPSNLAAVAPEKGRCLPGFAPYILIYEPDRLYSFALEKDLTGLECTFRYVKSLAEASKLVLNGARQIHGAIISNDIDGQEIAKLISQNCPNIVLAIAKPDWQEAAVPTTALAGGGAATSHTMNTSTVLLRNSKPTSSMNLHRRDNVKFYLERRNPPAAEAPDRSVSEQQSVVMFGATASPSLVVSPPTTAPQLGPWGAIPDDADPPRSEDEPSRGFAGFDMESPLDDVDSVALSNTDMQASTSGRPTDQSLSRQREVMALKAKTMVVRCTLSKPYSKAAIRKVVIKMEDVEVCRRVEEEERKRLEALMKAQKASAYRKTKRLGEGKFGQVWIAEDLITGGLMAVKIIPKLAVRAEDLRSEVQILRDTNHENIVTFIRCEEHESEYVLVMELCEKGSLLDSPLLKTHGIPVACRQETRDLTRSIFAQLISAVEYLHSKHIVHRDIKPANILITNQMKAKLADFGVSRMLQGKSGRSGAAAAQAEIAGTMLYLAPEALDGRFSAASDIYAIGVVALEIFGWLPPAMKEHQGYFFEPDPERRMAILQKHMVQMSELNVRASDNKKEAKGFVEQGQSFVRVCLEPDPNRRSTASDLHIHPFVAEKMNDPSQGETDHTLTTNNQRFRSMLKRPSTLQHFDVGKGRNVDSLSSLAGSGSHTGAVSSQQRNIKLMTKASDLGTLMNMRRAAPPSDADLQPLEKSQSLAVMPNSLSLMPSLLGRDKRLSVAHSTDVTPPAAELAPSKDSDSSAGGDAAASNATLQPKSCPVWQASSTDTRLMSTGSGLLARTSTSTTATTSTLLSDGGARGFEIATSSRTADGHSAGSHHVVLHPPQSTFDSPTSNGGEAVAVTPGIVLTLSDSKTEKRRTESPPTRLPPTEGSPPTPALRRSVAAPPRVVTFSTTVRVQEGPELPQSVDVVAQTAAAANLLLHPDWLPQQPPRPTESVPPARAVTSLPAPPVERQPTPPLPAAPSVSDTFGDHIMVESEGEWTIGSD